MSTEWFGIAGVALLLVAFGLNLVRRLAEDNPVYLMMNFLGAGLAAVYALQTGAIPFVVLESVWGGFAAIRFIQVIVRQSSNPLTK